MNSSKVPHAGALVPESGRITFTRKRNGRYYIGCDAETFVAILSLVRTHTVFQTPPPPSSTPSMIRANEVAGRLRDAAESAIKRIQAGKL